MVGYPSPDAPSLRVELVDFSQVFDRPRSQPRRGAPAGNGSSLARGVIDQRAQCRNRCARAQP
ncbi:hypothetical protein ACU4HD_47365 [Cupriavidus basilensis]